jgi:hypothetical protein
MLPGAFRKSRYTIFLNLEILLGIWQVKLLPVRHICNTSVMLPRFFWQIAMQAILVHSFHSSHPVHPPPPFSVRPCHRLITFGGSRKRFPTVSGSLPFIEAPLITMIWSLLMFANIKSSTRPCSFGLPGVHKDIRLRSFQRFLGRKPSKLLKANTTLLTYDVLLWQLIPYQ